MTILSRRGLIAGSLATGAAAVLQGCATMPTSSTAARPSGLDFFARRGLPIGLQVYTLGDEAGRDLDATFAALAAIGYRDLELPSLYGRPARDIRAAADRAGLAISSLHLPASMLGPAGGLSLASPPAEIAEAMGNLGARRAVVPIGLFPDGFRPGAGEDMKTAIARAFVAAGEDPWRRTAALLNQSGAALKPLGVSLGYHNHNMEFAPIGNTTGWDILVRETDPSLISFEVDTGWVATAGLDPATFLERHSGRVTQLHVKDVAASNRVNYGLSMQPAEVGSGTLDWARILPAAYSAGVRHFYVEQEPPFAIPRIEAARKGFEFLSQLRA